MPMLRPVSIQQILEELAASRFGLVAFDVSFPDKGDSLCSISFLPRKGCSFVIQGGGTSTNPISAAVSPGGFKTEDRWRFESFEDCLRQIQPWTRRIHEDLRAQSPNLDEISAFRQAMDAHIKATVKDDAAFFTDGETEELVTKLSELEQRIVEMEEKHVITENELKHLRQVIDDAKADLPAMPKGVWYKTAGGKVWEAMKKATATSEAKQLLADAARKLIGL